MLNIKKTNYMIFNFTNNNQFNARININGKNIEKKNQVKLLGTIINRPDVAGAVLQTALSLIHSLIHSSFSSKSCCLYNQVAEVEKMSPLSLKRCGSS